MAGDSATEIQRLIRQSEHARGVLGGEIRGLKRKLDVPARLKDSLKSHPTGWLGGSLVAGMFTSLLFRRKGKRVKEAEKKKKTVVGFLLGLAFSALRPFLKVWLAGQLKNFVASKFDQPDDIPSRPLRRVTPFYK